MKMKIIVVLLVLIIFSACSTNGQIDVSKINETELNNLVEQYKDDNEVRKFIIKNDIDLNDLSIEEDNSYLSCFAYNSKKQDKCMNRYGKEVQVNENLLILQQRNLRAGISVLYDEINWNQDKSTIKKVEIITNSNNYDLYLLKQGDINKQVKIGKKLNGAVSINLNKKYNSNDNKVYVYILDNDESKENTFEVYIEGMKR